MDKKNNTIIIILAIIVLVILALISIKSKNVKLEPEPISQTEMDLNQSIEADSSVDINASLDEIDMTDTIEEDLKVVDEEIKNL